MSNKNRKELGAGKIVKAERREKKVGLRSYYAMVVREPLEKGLRAYTRLVPIRKAAELVYGKMGTMGEKIKSTRTYRIA